MAISHLAGGPGVPIGEVFLFIYLFIWFLYHLGVYSHLAMALRSGRRSKSDRASGSLINKLSI